jgi:Ca2+-binding EF-hand superfamily protein
MPISIIVLTGLLAVAPPSASATVAHRHAGRPFISPMGEPFPVRAAGDDPLADWFQQADRNRDGSITLDEMQLDADRFFAALDTNHDGEIDPDEITHYEDVIAPQIRTGFGANFIVPAGAGDGSQAGGGRGGHGGGGRHHGGGGKWGGGARGGDDQPQGAARFGLLDLPEPVAAADADFNRGVSRDEFRKAAQLRFQALDVDRQGRLTLAVLETLRPAPPARPNKNPDAEPAVGPDSDPGG